MGTSSGVIDDYVRALDRALVGPRRIKAGMLVEVTDGLRDAAEAHAADGLDPAVAEHRAVAEFGAVRRLAPDFQRELAAASARRIAAATVLATACGQALSSLMWIGSPWSGEPVRAPESAGYLLVSGLVDWTGVALLVGAGLAFGWLTFGERYGRVGPGLVRAVLIGHLVGVAALCTAGFGIYLLTVLRWPEALYWPPMLAGGLLFCAGWAWLLRLGARGLAATRRLAALPG